jgi:hypothetical protein
MPTQNSTGCLGRSQSPLYYTHKTILAQIAPPSEVPCPQKVYRDPTAQQATGILAPKLNRKISRCCLNTRHMMWSRSWANRANTHSRNCSVNTISSPTTRQPPQMQLKNLANEILADLNLGAVVKSTHIGFWWALAGIHKSLTWLWKSTSSPPTLSGQ